MMISKTKHNSQEEQQREASDEEEYQTDEQHEEERFTDEYSEYFEDDMNGFELEKQVKTLIQNSCSYKILYFSKLYLDSFVVKRSLVNMFIIENRTI